MAQILKVQRLDPREESQNKDHGALKDFRVEDHNRPHQDTPRPKGEMMIPSTKRMPGQDGLLHWNRKREKWRSVLPMYYDLKFRDVLTQVNLPLSFVPTYQKCGK